MNFWSNCSKREQQKASPIPHDPGYPESAWGHCLPGDEAGYICLLDGECAEEPELCPLFEPSIYVCPDCGQNFIEKDDIFYCRECSKYYDAEEILGEKKYAKKIITL